jgi:hypothetical protein
MGGQTDHHINGTLAVTQRRGDDELHDNILALGTLDATGDQRVSQAH